MSRYRHDGTCTITRQYIVADPYRNRFAGKRIDGIRTTEYTGYLTVGDTFTFGTLLGSIQVSFHFFLLFSSSQLGYQFAFRSQYHEGNTVHGICTSGKDGKFDIAILHLELDFSTFRTTNPVLLGFLQRFGPVDVVQTIEQALSVCRYTETPLAHLLLNHRMTATFRNTVHYFVIGQNSTESRTPVYHGFAQVSDTIVHQDFLLFLFALGIPFFGSEVKFFATSGIETFCTLLCKAFFELADRHGLAASITIEVIEHLLERPLSPMIVTRFASADFAVPVKAETNLVQLFAVAVDVGFGSYRRMLTCLDSILFSRKTVSVITHRVQYVETLQALVACIDIAGNIAERVTYVQACSRWIREHVQHIEFLLRFVFDNLVGLVIDPSLLPFLLNFSEIVFHCFYDVMIIFSESTCKYTKTSELKRKDFTNLLIISLVLDKSNWFSFVFLRYLLLFVC